jgi:porphobilinogen synthase
MADSIVTTPGRTRLRRLRRTRALRNLVAETAVGADNLIMPHFVVPAARANEPISSMPGIAQQGLEDVVKQIGADLELGIRAVLLFGHPEHGGKTPDGAAAAAATGAVLKTCERL